MNEKSYKLHIREIQKLAHSKTDEIAISKILKYTKENIPERMRNKVFNDVISKFKQDEESGRNRVLKALFELHVKKILNLALKAPNIATKDILKYAETGIAEETQDNVFEKVIRLQQEKGSNTSSTANAFCELHLKKIQACLEEASGNDAALKGKIEERIAEIPSVIRAMVCDKLIESEWDQGWQNALISTIVIEFHQGYIQDGFLKPSNEEESDYQSKAIAKKAGAYIAKRPEDIQKRVFDTVIDLKWSSDWQKDGVSIAFHANKLQELMPENPKEDDRRAIIDKFKEYVEKDNILEHLKLSVYEEVSNSQRWSKITKGEPWKNLCLSIPFSKLHVKALQEILRKADKKWQILGKPVAERAEIISNRRLQVTKEMSVYISQNIPGGLKERVLSTLKSEIADPPIEQWIDDAFPDIVDHKAEIPMKLAVEPKANVIVEPKVNGINAQKINEAIIPKRLQDLVAFKKLAAHANNHGGEKQALLTKFMTEIEKAKGSDAVLRILGDDYRLDDAGVDLKALGDGPAQPGLSLKGHTNGLSKLVARLSCGFFFSRSKTKELIDELQEEMKSKPGAIPVRS